MNPLNLFSPLGLVHMRGVESEVLETSDIKVQEVDAHRAKLELNLGKDKAMSRRHNELILLVKNYSLHQSILDISKYAQMKI